MGNIRKITVLVTVLVCICAASSGVLAVEPSAVLQTLDKSHPRLMLKDKDLQNLKARYKDDKTLQKCVADTLRRADGYLDDPQLSYDKIGPRLLHISRRCMDRIYALALAYRWTGDEKYAAKAAENLLTVCAFKDWNPSHFLDTAEMSHAVGIGYDWLYSYLGEEKRRTIRVGLIKNGLEEGLVVYNTKGWWSKSEHNWNQVCNGGLIAGALAIAETDPKHAEQIVSAAVDSLPRALKSYGPDGAWGEGPGYWSYATHYTAYGLTALQTALGTDFGLSKIEGLSKAGDFPIYTTGPTGLYLNLADSGERASRRPMPCMFWLARVFDSPFYAESEHAQLAGRGASPQHVLWYVPAPKDSSPRQLDKYFRGPVEVATFRSSWGDADALFVGVKAGYNQVNHSHLDLGNFELDALGVRWARDLGSDNYNLPGYWDSKRGGKRWSYYRLNAKSHNLPLLNGEDQDPYAKSKMVRFESNKSSGFAIVDLTSAYEKFANKVTRGVAIVEGRRAVLVQDEFELKNTCELTWGMTTDAKITTEKGGGARLTLKGKELLARILSPAGAEFVAESAEQQPPQKTNKGVSRLVIRIPNATGDVRVAILLSPVWSQGTVESVRLKPLAQW